MNSFGLSLKRALLEDGDVQTERYFPMARFFYRLTPIGSPTILTVPTI